LVEEEVFLVFPISQVFRAFLEYPDWEGANLKAVSLKAVGLYPRLHL
jgi:hypothetical protein